MINYSIIY